MAKRISRSNLFQTAWQSIAGKKPATRLKSRLPLFEPLEERQLLSCGGVFSISATSPVAEGANVTVSVTLTGANCGPSETASVKIKTSDGTAVQSLDYTSKTELLSFTTNGTKTATVSTLPDAVSEGDEDFSVRLDEAGGAAVGSTTSTTVTITGTSTTAASLTVADIKVSEDNTNAIVTITASTTDHVTISGNWSTADGSALVASLDFTSSSGSFSIPSGTAAVTLSVPILEDSIDEWDEQFSVNLNSVTNAYVSDGSALVTILDDDGVGPLLGGLRTVDKDNGGGGPSFLCQECTEQQLFDSYSQPYDGDYSLKSSSLRTWEIDDYLPYPDGGDPGGSSAQRASGSPGPAPQSCQGAQQTGQAATPFNSESLPEYKVSNSGNTYVETRFAVPPSTGTVDKYVLTVTLTSGANGMTTTLGPIYYDGDDVDDGEVLVLGVQAENLAQGYYRTQSVVTAKYASGPDNQMTANGWTVAVNHRSSEYGSMWWLPTLDRLMLYSNAYASGAALVRGDGTTAWFNLAGGAYTNQTAGSFSTLEQESLDSVTYLVVTTRYNEKFYFDTTSGYLRKHRDSMGNFTAYGYNGSNQLETITNPYGQTTTYHYSSGKLTYVTNFAGQRVDYTIDGGQLKNVTFDDPDLNNGSDYQSSYDITYITASGVTQGFLDTVTFDWTSTMSSPHTATADLELHYDATGRISQILNPDESMSTVESYQLAVLSGLGTTTGTISNPALPKRFGAVVAEVLWETAGSKRYTFDGDGNTATLTDSYGDTTTFEWNSHRQIVSMAEPDPDGNGLKESAVTQFEYDNPASGGYVRVVTNPDGSEIHFDDYDTTYGIAGKVTDELGRITLYTIEDGNITEIEQQVGGTAGDSDDIVTSFTYTDGTGGLPKGLLESITDPEDIVTKYSYFTGSGKTGWLQSTTYNWHSTPNGEEIVETVDYDTFGNLSSFVDGEGNESNFKYDRLNQLRTVLGAYPNRGAINTVDNDTLPGDNDLNYIDTGASWSAGSNLGFGADQRRSQSGSSYSGNKATWTFNDLTPGKTYEIDVTWYATGQNGAPDSPFTVYDGTILGTPLATVPVNQGNDPKPHRLESDSTDKWEDIGRYVPTGNKLTVELNAGAATSGHYVLADAVRLIEAAPEETYECNEQGGTLKEIAPNGATREFQYNTNLRLTQIIYNDPTGGSATPKMSFEYDASGRVTRAIGIDPDGAGALYAPSVDYEYDQLSRIKTVKASYPAPTEMHTADDGQSGRYTSSGSWSNVGSAGEEGDYSFKTSGTAWTEWTVPDLTLGKTYEVLVDWIANGANDSAALYSVYDGAGPSAGGSALLGDVTVDQQDEPGSQAALRDPNNDSDTNGDNLFSLGKFKISSSSISVRLSGHNDVRLVADRVRVVEARAETTYNYDHAYNLASVVDLLGNTSTFDYDARHRLISVSGPDADGGGSTYSSGTSTFRYDAASQLIATEDPLHRTTRYFYDRYLPRLDHIRHQSATLQGANVDDQDGSGFETTGAWTTDDGGYDLHNRYATSSAASAEWSFSVDPGDYEVFASWVADEANANAAVYTVNNGTNHYVTVDQSKDPADGHYRGDAVLWQSLGDFALAGGDLTVTLTGQNGVRVVADSIWLVPKELRTTYDYYPSGNVHHVTDQLGNETTYEYDDLHRLQMLTLPDPDKDVGATGDVQAWYYEYDDNSNVARVTDPIVGATEYAYDGLNRLTQTTLADPDPSNGITTDRPVYKYAYDIVSNLLQFTDPRDHVTSYSYDTWSRLLKTTYPRPLGSDTVDPYIEYDYDLLSRVTTAEENLTASTTRTTSYEYDRLSRLVKTKLPDPTTGAASGSNPIYTTAYDLFGAVVAETDALGNTTRYEYDNLQRLSKTLLPDPDGGGDQLSPYSTYLYDAGNQLTSVTSTLTAKVDSGTPTYTTATSYYDYDRLGRQWQARLPDPDTGAPGSPLIRHLYTYDAVGNLLAWTNPLDEMTNYTYDNLYRVTKEEQPDPDGPSNPLGRPTIEYGYDLLDNVTSYKDPNNNTTEYEYDGLSRLKTETITLPGSAPAGGAKSRTYSYDNSGNLTQKVDRNGRKTVFTFDAWDRLYEENWYATSGSSTSLHKISYALDFAGDVTNAKDDPGADNSALSEYNFTYDRLGQAKTIGVAYAATSNIVSLAATLTQNFDANGNREDLAIALAANGGTTRNDFKNTYQYDALDRMKQVVQDKQSGTHNEVAKKQVDFSYRADGQFETINRKGNPAGTMIDIVLSTYKYDEIGRLTELEHSDVASPTTGSRSKFNWQYDDFDRLTQKAEGFNGGTQVATDYTYDATNQLKNVTVGGVTSTFTYDINGNRTGPGDYEIVIGGYNRSDQDDLFEYEYDAEGNMTERRRLDPVGNFDDLATFEWDHRNRLTKLTYSTIDDTDHDHPITALYSTIDYTYDAFDRRIRVARLNAADANYSVSRVSQIILDGEDNVLLTNRDGTITNRFLHGPAIDQILADEQYGASGHTAPSTQEGITYWTLVDNLGSVRQLVDNTGGELQRVNYSEFGKTTIAVNGGLKQTYGYTGREREDASHLQYNRARYYDQRLNRWISEDPLGYAAGDSNLYRYVGNSPTNGTDPSGLQEFKGPGGFTRSPTGESFREAIDKVPRPKPEPSILGTAATAVGEMIADAYVGAFNDAMAFGEDVLTNGVHAAVTNKAAAIAQNKIKQAADAIDYGQQAYRLLRQQQSAADAAANAAIAAFLGEYLNMKGLFEAVHGERIVRDTEGLLTTEKLCDKDRFKAFYSGTASTVAVATQVYGFARIAAVDWTKKCLSDFLCFAAGTEVVVSLPPAENRKTRIVVAGESSDAGDWYMPIAVGLVALSSLVLYEQTPSQQKRAMPSPVQLKKRRGNGSSERKKDKLDEKEPSQTPPLSAVDQCHEQCHCATLASDVPAPLSSRALCSEPASNPVTAIPRRRLRGLHWSLAAIATLWIAFLGAYFSRPVPSGHQVDAGQEVAAAAPTAFATRKIEGLRVGERVIASPSDRDALQPTAVDPATWRKLRLHAEQVWPDGTRDEIEVETLQPPQWLAQHSGRVGDLVPPPLDLVEMGMPADLMAEVVGNEPCTAPEEAPGRVVLTTVNHLNNYLFKLDFADENGTENSVEVTGYHKLYSDDRQAWTSVADLQSGERLRGLASPLTVSSLSRIPGAHRVFNLTVEDEHTYHVTPAGLLAHNTCADNGPVKPGDAGTHGELQARRKASGQSEPLHMDHQPSFAAQVAAKEKELGRKLRPDEKAQLRDSTPAVGSPPDIHRGTSPTYGGRNTPARIESDANDLGAAAARDRAAFDEAMRKRGMR